MYYEEGGSDAMFEGLAVRLYKPVRGAKAFGLSTSS